MTNDAQDLAQPLFEKAQLFFEGMAQSSALQENLSKIEQTVQFEPKEGEPFFVRIGAGKIEFGKGSKYPKNIVDGLYISEVQDSLAGIFKGELTLGEAIFHQKIRIPGYRNKEPAIANFSMLLRLGVWVFISSPLVLMPTK